MIPMDQLLPDLLSAAPGCPEPLAINAIRRASILLCEAGAWPHVLDPITLQAGVADYALPLPPESEVELIRVVYCGDRILPLVSEAQAYQSGWAPIPASGTPQALQFREPDTLRLLPTPAVADTLRVNLLLRPSENACELSNGLYRRWGRELVQGALADLLNRPNAPWRDPASAQGAGVLFSRALSRVRLQLANGGPMIREMRVAMRPFV